MIDNPVEWFQKKTGELDNDLTKKSALSDMKSIVMNSEKGVLDDIVRNVSINPIFECLNTTDLQDIKLICTIIYELLAQMTPKELLDVYGNSMLRSLSHPSGDVKETVLKLLEKTTNENTVEDLLKKHPSLLTEAAGCLALPERSTAQGAISMFINMGNTAQGLKVLYSNLILNKFKEVMLIDETSRFRVYEIIVAVSKMSAENLSMAISSGLMGSLISEISSPDILIQLNVLEMLSNLASSNHGLNYLQECNVIQNLVDKLLKLNEEPLALVLLPGLVEFFGNLCILQPESFTKEYPQVMDLLFNSLDTQDEILLGVIINTIGSIGATPSGRLVLSNYEEKMKSFFKKTGQILTSRSDSTITVLNSLGMLLQDINGDAKLNQIAKQWFDSITPNILDSTVNLSKLPFLEYRLSALGLLKAIGTQQWGAEQLSNFPGMIEFLSDRSTEFNKDCKQTKFEIVLNMVQCPNIEQILAPEVLHSLKEFVEEGPFFVPPQVEMATEGASF